MKRTTVLAGIGLFSSLLPFAHPTVGQEPDPLFAGGFTVVGQTTDDERIRSEVTASVDLFVTVPAWRGSLLAYLEANSSPLDNGVSTVLGEVNTDAGTALNRSRKGRVQISELKYRLELPRGDRFTIGLLDATGYLDTSRIANDENLHFLGISFVNNPTIEFPDYALGVVFERARRGRLPRITAVLTSSNGLADNTNLSYVELISLSESDKGVFGGIALRWTGERQRLGIGAWTQTASHETFDGSRHDAHNYGAYAIYGRTWEHHALNVRAGVANPDVFLAGRFLGATYLTSVRSVAVGVGAARTWVSAGAEEVGWDDSAHLETFFRVQLPGGIYLTPSVQYVRNSGFDPSGEEFRPEVFVGGFRLSLAF